MTQPDQKVDREVLRRAIVYGWSKCIPRFHCDLDRVLEALNDPSVVSDDVTASGPLYTLDDWECWGGTDE